MYKNAILCILAKPALSLRKMRFILIRVKYVSNQNVFEEMNLNKFLVET